MGAVVVILHKLLREVDGIESLPTFNVILGGYWKLLKIQSHNF
jgi:hypothetical protein